MPLQQELRKRIEEKFGQEIKSSADYDRLKEDIEHVTKYTIGLSTLKRMFGFANDCVGFRHSTMDVIAKYCGYESAEDMTRNLGATLSAID